jgi:hypothetical protein
MMIITRDSIEKLFSAQSMESVEPFFGEIFGKGGTHLRRFDAFVEDVKSTLLKNINFVTLQKAVKQRKIVAINIEPNTEKCAVHIVPVDSMADEIKASRDFKSLRKYCRDHSQLLCVTSTLEFTITGIVVNAFAIDLSTVHSEAIA